MNHLEKKADMLCAALKRLSIKQVEFAAITGRSVVQIGKMMRADVNIPDYIWGFLLLTQTVDRYAPEGWLRSHIERVVSIQKEKKIAALQEKLRKAKKK